MDSAQQVNSKYFEEVKSMKKERGAITLITLVTIVFMISFLIGTYVIMSNRRQAQEEIKRKTR